MNKLGALNPWLRGTRPGDWLLIAILLALTVTAQLYLVRTGIRGAMAEIFVDGELRLRLALDEPRAATVDGRLGPVHLEVEGGAIRAVDSPCPHKVCIRMGRKKRAGDTIVCVPSRLLVRITGTPAENEVDAIAR